ncbi:hypothetical protein BXZ70DRAFT_1006728 [Cristinia sonorae]|uniref:Uncharacterized protein n=1 Tax=Cristinia sonorae TaxID=1940300 RepID=A0A8K0USA8_9AGAR|nr:hypothetical protein BXZ70DRAFT_1006728 [Cristinia sonorae]
MGVSLSKHHARRVGKVPTVPRTDLTSILPTEIWENILEFIAGDHGGTKTLKAFSLISRLGCIWVRPLLFRTLFIYCSSHRKDYFEKLHQVLVAPDSISHLVHDLILYGFPGAKFQKPPPAPLSVQMLSCILAALPNLRNLEIKNVKLVVETETTSSIPVKVKYLDRLTLHCIFYTLPKSPHEQCPAAVIIRLLGVFGKVAQFSFNTESYASCDCVERTFEDLAHQWLTDEYHRRVLEAHPVLDSHLAVTSLDLSQVYDTRKSVSQLLLKTIQHTPSVHSLTSLSMCCDHPRKIVAHGELVRCCAPRLIECEISLRIGSMFAASAWQHLALTECTSLKALTMVIDVICDDYMGSRIGLEAFLGVLSFTHLDSLEDITLRMNLSSVSANRGLAAAQGLIGSPTHGINWANLRQILRRCTRIKNLNFDVTIQLGIGTYHSNYPRHPAPPDLVGWVDKEMQTELAEWHEKKVLHITTSMLK